MAGRGRTRKKQPKGASPLALPIPADLTPTDLTLRRTITFPDYLRAAGLIGNLGGGVLWWVGALLVQGEELFGEKFAQVEAVLSGFGYSPQTLLNIASVYRNVAPSRRREVLPWSFHQDVSKLSPENQEQWLARAEKEHWTRAQLRAALRPRVDGAGAAEGGAVEPPDVGWLNHTLRLLDVEQHEVVIKALELERSRLGVTYLYQVIPVWAEQALAKT